MRPLFVFCEVVSLVNFGSGLLFNILLLYLIMKYSPKSIGTYKYLMGLFSTYNIYLVAMHQIINPKVIPSRTGFSVCSDSNMDSRLFLSFCSSGYAVPFVLLNIHFIYRYWLIRSPYRIALFSNIKFILLLITIAAILQTSWCLSTYFLGMPDDISELRHFQTLFREEYEKDINDGCIIMNYWSEGTFKVRSFLLLVVADSVEIVSFTLAGTLASLTYREIRKAQNMSQRVRDYHLRILLAASAQTFTPALFVYTPYFLNVNMPLFHIYSPTFSAVSMVLLSFFPGIDAIVIIILMKPYREGLLNTPVFVYSTPVVMMDSYDRPTQTFTISVSAFGVAANALLLVAIHTRSSPAFRAYSTILSNTAAVDLIASMAAAFSVTRLASSPATATTYLIFTGFCSSIGRIPCWLIHVIENQMWMTSNYFLCFAFAYRLMSVRKQVLPRTTVVIVSIFIHLFNCLTAATLFSLFLENDCMADDAMTTSPFERHIQQTDYEFAAFRFNTVRSIVEAVLIIFSSPFVFGATVVLRQLTVRTLRASQHFMSASTRDLHQQLVKTLNYQLSLTTLFGIGCSVFGLQLFGIVEHPLSEVLPCAIVCMLPAIAPVFNLICIRPYRMFVFQIVRGKKSTSVESIQSFSLSRDASTWSSDIN